MAVLTVYVGNDNVITLTGLQDAVDDSYENGATVTVTLQDSSGNEVSGETWPLTLSYVASSNGNYRGTLSDSLSLTDDAEYTAVIDADAGAGAKGHWEIPVTAQTRTS